MEHFVAFSPASFSFRNIKIYYAYQSLWIVLLSFKAVNVIEINLKHSKSTQYEMNKNAVFKAVKTAKILLSTLQLVMRTKLIQKRRGKKEKTISNLNIYNIKDKNERKEIEGGRYGKTEADNK